METNPYPTREACALRAYVGCRTTQERAARGQGIEVFEVTPEGPWKHLQTVVAGDNPSYLLADKQGRDLYCVHGDGTAVSSFQVGLDGALSLRGTHSTQGRNPVHLAFSPQGRWLLVSNYASATVVSLPVLPDGSLGAVVHSLALPDRQGPHRTQQKGAHPHQVVFDPSGRWLLVPDKGGDAVHTLAFDESTGALRLAASLQVPPGSGPRHLVFDAGGCRAWIVFELTSQIVSAAFDAESGRLTPVQRIPSIPESFVGENTGSGIVLDAADAAIWVSNRGHGSVVRLAIDETRHTLHAPAWFDAQGRVPRFISAMPQGAGILAGTLIANEDADTIVGIEPGTSTPHRILARAGSPVCIVFIQGTP